MGGESRSCREGIRRCPASLRLSMKEYTSWHSRISNLIFFGILLGTVAILCVVATLNAVGYFGNSESGLLRSLSPVLEEVGSSNGSLLRSQTLVLITNTSDGPSSLFPVADLSTLSDVYHNMTEAELLWRASAGAMSRPRPATVPPKVAFLFLTRGPMPLAPLWERYFKAGHAGLYSIYLHAHPDYRPDFPPDSVFYRRNIPSKEVFWGRISVYLAERRLLANALLDAANERFVHLSESCIPIAPFPVTYKYFTESEHSFVQCFEDPGRAGLGRYKRIKHREKLNPEVSPSQWRKGGQWFEMSRALAVMVIADNKYLPKFQTLLCMNDTVCFSEEHYLPTMLAILAAPKLANRSTTYVDFHLHKAHPKTWEPEEITEALLKNIATGGNCTYNGKVTKTCYMFARKFSPGTIRPLLKLAATSFGIS